VGDRTQLFSGVEAVADFCAIQGESSGLQQMHTPTTAQQHKFDVDSRIVTQNNSTQVVQMHVYEIGNKHALPSADIFVAYHRLQLQC